MATLQMTNHEKDEKANGRAVAAPTRFVDVEGRRLAYRVVGRGRPLVLCNRLRGVLDVWDPAFLDALATTFTVYTFDYTGLGLSSGVATYDHLSLARDARDLIAALDLGPVVIGGWSLGGIAAQVFMTEFPELCSHAILIGTVPPGEVTRGAEPLFFETAMKPRYTVEDETILFFEPKSEPSRRAAELSNARIAARTSDRSPSISAEVAKRLLAEVHGPDLFTDRLGTRAKMASCSTPMLVLSGDHDIVFAVENWYARAHELPNAQIIVFNHAGHGPQHQFPTTVAKYIGAFVGSMT